MNRIHDSDDDDDDYSSHPSPLSQTQRFIKSGNLGSKELKMTSAKSKHNEVGVSKLNLKNVNDNSSSDSDDDTTTKTGRSTSSATPSQLTPKPRERSFLRSNTDKPKVQPRRIDIDDDDHNVFGKTTMEPSPRHQISTLKEDEERDQSFAQGFRDEKKRKSPTDMFAADSRSRPTVNSRKFHSDRSTEDADSDDQSFHNKQRKSNNFHKSPRSPIDNTRSSSRKDSLNSDEDDDDHEHSSKHFQQQDYTKRKSSNHDLGQTLTKNTDLNTMQHPSSSSSTRPGSAGKKEVEFARRSSYSEDRDTVIPSVTNQKTQSQPTSVKSGTTRQQTQSAIDNVISANVPHTRDPLTANNEALAETLRPSTPPIPPHRPSAQLPPRPKPGSNTTATRSTINKKPKYKVPSHCKDIGARIDTGRTSTNGDLTKSIQREIEKELKSLTLTRPQTARIRQNSANSHTSETRRRRSSSAYENVKPRVNTNRSINFDELNTSQMRAESSQSIKDGVYFEWLKAKEDQRKLEKEELQRQKEELDKRLNKSQIEVRVQQQAKTLETWRRTKDEEIRRKRREERELLRQAEEQKKREEQQKKKDAVIGFESWNSKKSETFKQKADDERMKKIEFEKRQKEKQDKFCESEKKVDEWMEEKARQLKKAQKEKKTVRNDQLKTIRHEEETKFVNAQEAYEKWLKDKDKYEIKEKIRTQRRNSLATQQPQVPFLPGGAQKNTGKIHHAVW